MIATRRRMAIRDFLLITVAGAVIALALWPPAPARQTVLLRSNSGVMQPYSFAVGDPRLERLQSELEKWSSRLPDAALAKAMWRVEMADFYAEQTKPRSSAENDILRVSFSDQQSKKSESVDAARWLAQHEHWVRVGGEARQNVTDVRTRLERLRALADSAPIQFGGQLTGKLPRQAFLVASIAGFVLATFFACWTRLCPAMELQSHGTSIPQSSMLSQGASREMQFTVPASWVRVHQPAAVVIRRLALLLIVATALAMVTQLVFAG